MTLTPSTVSKYNKDSLCYQQPIRRSQLAWPTSEEHSQVTRPKPVSRRHESQWPERTKSLASRASRRTRSMARKSTTRRPMTKDPEDSSRDVSFDFIHNQEDPPRAVSPIQRRLSPFRPLQLSIYLPGKELPALPKFSDDHDDDDEIPPVLGIERPPQALMTTKSEPNLTRRLSSFSIPRKPVGGSRGSSLELTAAIRPSIDSGLTLYNPDAALSTHKRSTSIDRLLVDHRPSLSTSKSAQEFLEIINAPLPPLPQSTPTSHEIRDDFAPKSAFAIYKSASDQNMRLRTHLEERQEVCDTISEKEERSPVSPLTPPQPATFPRPSSTASRSSQIFVQQSFQQRDSLIHPAHRQSTNVNSKPTIAATAQPAWTDSDYEFPLSNFRKARSSSGSSTLLKERMAEAGFVQQANEADMRPTVTTTISVCPSTPTLSHRLSQWLTRSIATKHVSNANNTAPGQRGSVVRSKSTWDLSSPGPLTIGPGAVTLPGEIKKANSVPGSKTSPLIKGHRKHQSSVDTYVPNSPEEAFVGQTSIDIVREKMAVPIVTERRVSAVGLAF